MIKTSTTSERTTARPIFSKKWGKAIRGFTLVELIVVITILAILATVGFLALSGYTQDAKVSATSANVRSIATAISSESAISWNSPRRYVSHDSAYALSGAFVYVDGASTALTGGNLGEAPNDSNYTAGKPRYDLLKLNPEKFKVGSSIGKWLEGHSAYAVFDPSAPAIGALDVRNGKRVESWFQVAAVLNDQKKAVVVGTFPNTLTWSTGTSTWAVPGLLAVEGGPGGNKSVLIDWSWIEAPAGTTPAVMATSENLSTALAFGTVAVNSAVEKNLVIRNDASAWSNGLTITTNAVAAPFSVTQNTCSAIAAGQNCTVTVRYSPTAQITSSATVVLTSSEWAVLNFSASGTWGGDPYWANVTGLFRFDGTSSPFANTKIPTNTLSWSNTSVSHYTASGKFWNSALFNGISQYGFGATGILALWTSTSYTVEAWTRLDSAIPVSSANWQGAAIFARHGDGTRLFFYYARFPASAGQAATHVCASWANWLSTFRSADACAVIPASALGSWNHVAVSHDGTTNAATLYYNGKKLGTVTTNTTALTPSTGPNNGFFVGATNIWSWYEGYFPGAIDDMRVTVGAARYNQDFIPPTGQYPAF